MNKDFFATKDKFFRTMDDDVIKLLLTDKSTKRNIVWATDQFSSFGDGYQLTDEISDVAIKGPKNRRVRARVEKSKVDMARRVKKNGEVFTPSYICNNQNNLVDNNWFGRKDVFNVETNEGWITTQNKIEFPEGKTWQDYVDSKKA